MKVRRMSLVVVLVLLSAILLAVPVQAGRNMSQFTFHLTRIDVDYFIPRENTGAVFLFAWGIAGPVEGSGDNRVNGTFTWDVKSTTILPNSHYDAANYGWGPGTGTWRIASEDGFSGWEGNSIAFALGDLKPSNPFRARGVGFGKYKNMQIEWTVMLNIPFDPSQFVFSGEISENSK